MDFPKNNHVTTGRGGAENPEQNVDHHRCLWRRAAAKARQLRASWPSSLNSTISGLTRSSPFNPIEEFKGEYRCIASDLRNASGGHSSGPLEIDRPWDAYTDDHLGLMDHLGIDRFMVMGFCIGGPFIWNLLRRAPDRIIAAVLAQPSGSRPEMRDLFYEGNMKTWGPALTARRPDITMEMVEKFLTQMYRTNPDFVFTVTREFVRNCQTPILILPDDIPAHPYAVAMEAAMLAPKAEVSMFPWKEPKDGFPWRCAKYVPSFERIDLLRLSLGRLTGVTGKMEAGRQTGVDTNSSRFLKNRRSPRLADAGSDPETVSAGEVLSSAGHALRVHVERIDRVARRHEQPVAVTTAEADIGSALGQRYEADRLADRIEHLDAVERRTHAQPHHKLPSTSTRKPSGVSSFSQLMNMRPLASFARRRPRRKHRLSVPQVHSR